MQKNSKFLPKNLENGEKFCIFAVQLIARARPSDADIILVRLAQWLHRHDAMRNTHLCQSKPYFLKNLYP